ncbi:MAG: hypothetical protein HYY05_08145 [Chloroflexi bacterium]|nr:hypothetical protein [Chloroflexota bacterium]
MYVRITHLFPASGRHVEAAEALDAYIEWLRLQPGFIVGLKAHVQGRLTELVRIVAWERARDADAAAVQAHAIAASSHLIGMTRDQTLHHEHLEGERVVYAGAPALAGAGA